MGIREKQSKEKTKKKGNKVKFLGVTKKVK